MLYFTGPVFLANFTINVFIYDVLKVCTVINKITDFY